uniref:Putative secreted protein n=1 Tax=Ixodes ricinus TaxID=34613 RepID=A0A6B0U198_IXORI
MPLAVIILLSFSFLRAFSSFFLFIVLWARLVSNFINTVFFKLFIGDMNCITLLHVVPPCHSPRASSMYK